MKLNIVDSSQTVSPSLTFRFQCLTPGMILFFQWDQYVCEEVIMGFQNKVTIKNILMIELCFLNILGRLRMGPICL